MTVEATPITTPTKKKSSKSQYEPLADAARAYEIALQSLVRAQTDADMSGLDLSKTQTDLLTLFQSPEWLRMPEMWRAAVAEQAGYTLAAEQAAASQERLNALLAATPTAQLEQQRNTMAFLAQAFEQGTISAQQFSEAAAAALGNVPATAVDNTAQKLIDLSLVANDAARQMASAFGDFFAGQDVSVKEMPSSFLKATAKMIAQAAILKAIQTAASSAGGGWGALFSNLFSDGGAFGPGGQIKAFATGGVVDRPTLFKFASGGGFSTGIMGEAGPESIMPLKRGADGKLGVVAHGGAGMTINQAFNVTVEGSDDPNAGRRQGDMIGKELQRQVKSAVREVLVQEKRYGGLLA